MERGNIVSASDTAIAIIKAEHKSLGTVLHTMQALLSRIAAGHIAADFGLLAAALYYIDDFPECCHHPKEDEYLFKRLRLRTAEFDAVLDRLQTEHVQIGHGRAAAHMFGLQLVQHGVELGGAQAHALEQILVFLGMVATLRKIIDVVKRRGKQTEIRHRMTCRDLAQQRLQRVQYRTQRLVFRLDDGNCRVARAHDVTSDLWIGT